MNFIVWKWRSAKYRTTFTADHVNALARMIAQNYKAPHRFVCITDDPAGIDCETYPLWDDYAELPNPCAVHPDSGVFPSCYRRLRIFDRATTRAMGMDGQMVCSMDLDALVLQPIFGLLNMWPESPFVGWRNFVGAAWKQPRAFNGSLFRFKAGSMSRLWTDFDPATSPQLAKAEGFFGSDQAWIGYCLSGAPEYPGWSKDHGVLSYASNLCSARGTGGRMPASARMIFFNGRVKPWDEEVIRAWPWTARYWHKTIGEPAKAV